MNEVYLDRFELPYNYYEASEYSFKEVVSTLDNNFWRMFKLRTSMGELYFHKRTNLVFDERFELIGRYIMDKICLLEELDNYREIVNWFKTCRATPMSNRDIFLNDVLDV